MQMEDYAGAYESRLSDVRALLGLPSPRTIAAVHLGGVAIECRLKDLVLAYHKIASWNEKGSRPKDTWLGKPIARPGHGLASIMRLMNDLYQKGKNDKNFLTHLNRLMHPTGATQVDFIELRYTSTEVSKASLKDWNESLEYICGWLKKNEKVTP